MNAKYFSLMHEGRLVSRGHFRQQEQSLDGQSQITVTEKTSLESPQDFLSQIKGAPVNISIFNTLY